MNQDDQRDMAEEAANRALLHETDEQDIDLATPETWHLWQGGAKAYIEAEASRYRTFAEDALKFYTSVAGHQDYEIASSDNNAYKGATSVLFYAIALAYPDLSETDIKEVFDECVYSGENVADSVKAYTNRIED
jgi:hypothetical protein